MSKEKKAAALDERALEGVSGGAFNIPSGTDWLFRCPACGAEKISGRGKETCPNCQTAMERIKMLQ